MTLKTKSTSNNAVKKLDVKSNVKLENQHLFKAEIDDESEYYAYENPDILDFDLKNGRPNAVLIPEFNFVLKPHQLHGIHFLYNACIGTLEKFRQGDLGSGAILAHCMGLGKTFESIAFISTIFAHTELRENI